MLGIHLAIHACQLPVERCLPILHKHRRSLLRCLEQAHRTALDHHVCRPSQLGPWVLINERWYKLADRLFNAPAVCRGISRKSGLSAWSFTTLDNRVPRPSAANRLVWLSYPFSVIAMRGRMSGQVWSDVSNCVLSPASPPVRWKSRGSAFGQRMDPIMPVGLTAIAW
jgi:hypothetical protein